MRGRAAASHERPVGRRTVMGGALVGAATLGLLGVAETRRLRAVPILPSVAAGLDEVVAVGGVVRQARPVAHLAVLGDSVAAGVGVPDVAETWPHALATRVAAAVDGPVRVRSLGVCGARVGDVVADQLPRLVADDGCVPDVAVLTVGTNDVTHLTPLARFAEDFETLVRACRGLGARPVVTGLPDFRALAVLSPPLRYAAFGLGARIHRLQRALADTVEGAVFVDVKAVAGQSFRSDRSLLANDRFHPSAAGCVTLADCVAPAVVDALGAGATGSP